MLLINSLTSLSHFPGRIFALLLSSWLSEQEGRFDFIKPTTIICMVVSPWQSKYCSFTLSYSLCWRSCHRFQITKEEAPIPEVLWSSHVGTVFQVSAKPATWSDSLLPRLSFTFHLCPAQLLVQWLKLGLQ
jgi:hypothetical protein